MKLDKCQRWADRAAALTASQSEPPGPSIPLRVSESAFKLWVFAGKDLVGYVKGFSILESTGSYLVQLSDWADTRFLCVSSWGPVDHACSLLTHHIPAEMRSQQTHSQSFSSGYTRSFLWCGFRSFPWTQFSL